MRSVCTALLVLMAGCGSSGGSGGYRPSNGDGGGDLTAVDLASGPVDLRGVPVDLARPPDPDLAWPPAPDLARPPVVDLAWPPPADLASASPCGSVPTTGVCIGTTRVDQCVIPTGQGTPTVVSKTCKAWEQCQVVGGIADCVTRPGACQPGTSECTGADTKRTCDSSGAWVSGSCPMCQSSVLGAVCGGATTASWSGTLRYEARGPNSGYTGWNTSLFVAAAQGVLVISYKYDSTARKYTSIDSTVTDSTGRFTIKIPTQPGTNDAIVAWAVRARPGGLSAGMAYAIGQPDVPDGVWSVSQPIPGGEDAAYWGWEWGSSTLGASGGILTIKEADGSGAMRLFDELRYAYDSAATLFGKQGSSLIMWMRPNTSWSCGACSVKAPVNFLGYDFGAQIFIPATAQDQSYWSDAVTVHEIGHWLMSAYGTSPGEGGPHTVGCPTFPGQAYSEGWATGYSGLVRGNPVYYDKQGGTFFWLDIAQRKYSGSVVWQAPKPTSGLLQQMDENEVAAMVWRLADNPTDPKLSLTGNKQLFTALASARMNTKPFGRGYTTRRWSAQPGTCTKSNITDTGVSAPMMADYLDALRCGGMTASRVDVATDPVNRYPYPSNAPICQ